MVHGDIDLDVNGVPVNLPQIRYERAPMVIRKLGGYEDWLQRNAGPGRLVSAIETDVQELAHQVAKLEWERELRMRPPVPPKVIEFNKRITDVLEGNGDAGTRTDSRVATIISCSRTHLPGFESPEGHTIRFYSSDSHTQRRGGPGFARSRDLHSPENPGDHYYCIPSQTS